MKTKKTIFVEPDLTDRELILFLHFRLTSLFAELEVVKDLVEYSKQTKPAQLSISSASNLDAARKAYEHEAEVFWKRLQELKKQGQN